MIKVQLPTREHCLHELNLNYGDVVFLLVRMVVVNPAY